MNPIKKQLFTVLCRETIDDGLCCYKLQVAYLQMYSKSARYLACYFIKKRLQQRCFLVNIAIFLRTVFL